MEMRLGVVVAPVSEVDAAKDFYQGLGRRLDAGIGTYGSASGLAGAMRRAPAAHGGPEKRIGEADPNRPGWSGRSGRCLVAGQAGTEPPA